jgi:protein SCO1/2
MRNRCFTILGSISLALALGLSGSQRAHAQLRANEVPPELKGVGITEHLGETVPLDIHFKDEQGNDVTLRDYLKPGRPVILTPVYYECPMLCNLTLNGLVDGLNDVELSAGRDFEIVSFSFNPKEQPKLAEVKKRAYLTQYHRESAKEGWHFLTSDKDADLHAMCDAIGFGYKYDPHNNEYAHTSTIMFLTPDGKLARYINDVKFEPKSLKFALMEASQGTIGSAMDKFLLFMCYHYDPDSRSYAASAVQIMRVGGVMTIILMLTGFGLLWWRGSQGSAAPTLDSHESESAHETVHEASLVSAGSRDST